MIDDVRVRTYVWELFHIDKMWEEEMTAISYIYITYIFYTFVL